MTDGWTIAGTIANSIAGLGAVGAVMIALATLRRQVNDRLGAQAGRVLVNLPEHIDVAHPANYHEIEVVNLSDLPIFRVSTHLRGYGGAGPYEQRIRRLGGGETKKISLRNGISAGETLYVGFTDSQGVSWERSLEGELLLTHPPKPGFLPFVPRQRSPTRWQ